MRYAVRTRTTILTVLLLALATLPGLSEPTVRPLALADSATATQAQAAKPLHRGLTTQAARPEACTTETILCNTARSGVLDASDCQDSNDFYYDAWEFEASLGTTVTVDVMSTSFDAYALLWDPDFLLAAEDDDSGDGNNARVSFVIDTIGTWTADATTFFAGSTGAYTIQLTCSAFGAPLPPSNLQAGAVSQTEVQLSWDDNSTDETEFRVESRPAGGVFTDIGSVPADSTAASVTGLSPSTSYDFRILASNILGDSAYSNTASATTHGGNGACIPDLTEGVVCLRDRFEISATWTNFANPPVTNPIIWTLVEDINATGGFQNNPTGIQIVMRVADGCHITGTWWVWLGGFTDAGWNITVRDTVTGAQTTFVRERQGGDFPTTLRDLVTFGCD